MDEVFVSYRRDDAGYVAAHLADALRERFGDTCVFLDTRALLPGVPFPAEIDRALRRCLVLLVLIGPGWLAARAPAGHRRIDDPDDWVRRELRIGLEHGVPMVPVLLDQATLPQPRELPADVRGLLRHGLARVAADSFPADVAALVEHVRRLAPRLHEVPVAASTPAGPVQHNRVEGGGDLYASQGGGMTVNNVRPRRGRG